MRSKREISVLRRVRQPYGLSEIARRVLRYANRGLPRVDFLRRVSKAIMDYSGCDAVELRLKDPELNYSWEASKQLKGSFRFAILGDPDTARGKAASSPTANNQADLERTYQDILRSRLKPSWPISTRQRSFWTGDTHKAMRLGGRARAALGGLYRSLAVIRFAVDDRTLGLLQLKSLQPHYFTREEVESYEGFAQTLGLAIANRRSQWALRERVKELTCLYGIAQVAQRRDISLSETLQNIAELLPPAWQYPEISTARILLDGQAHTTHNFRVGPYRQTADTGTCVPSCESRQLLRPLRGQVRAIRSDGDVRRTSGCASRG